MNEELRKLKELISIDTDFLCVEVSDVMVSFDVIDRDLESDEKDIKKLTKDPKVAEYIKKVRNRDKNKATLECDIKNYGVTLEKSNPALVSRIYYTSSHGEHGGRLVVKIVYQTQPHIAFNEWFMDIPAKEGLSHRDVYLMARNRAWEYLMDCKKSDASLPKWMKNFDWKVFNAKLKKKILEK